jgi:hypothetical protein
VFVEVTPARRFPTMGRLSRDLKVSARALAKSESLKTQYEIEGNYLFLKERYRWKDEILVHIGFTEEVDDCIVMRK